MISLQRSMHSSQMYTPGPAMSFLTCFCDFPQKEHFSRSPPSPMRATEDLLLWSRRQCRLHHRTWFRDLAANQLDPHLHLQTSRSTHPSADLDATPPAAPTGVLSAPQAGE